jgi:hypothetical protein
MTKTVEQAIEALHDLPKDRQERLARAMLDYAAQVEEEVYHLSEDERTEIRVGLEQAKRGEFISDAEMQRYRHRHHA